MLVIVWMRVDVNVALVGFLLVECENMRVYIGVLGFFSSSVECESLGLPI